MMLVTMLVLIDADEMVSLFLHECTSSHHRIASHAVATMTTDFAMTTVKALVFTLTAHWAMDLNLDFGFCLTATILFGQTQVALAQMFVALVHHPKTALDCAPPLLLPPILFLGTIVSQEALPRFKLFSLSCAALHSFSVTNLPTALDSLRKRSTMSSVCSHCKMFFSL